ncbi:MAG: response regulator transcription factor [Bacteroidota bacterium]
MSTIRCIIVDDEPLAIRLLKAHVEQVPELKLIATFDQAVMALSYLRQHHVDLIFLDIQMPAVTGLEFAKAVGQNSAIVFTTAYREYAVESYELHVVDYLVKPITFARFYRAINKVLARQNPGPVTTTHQGGVSSLDGAGSPDGDEFRYFNVNKKYVRVRLADITHVESVKDYVKIITLNGQISTREKISDFARTLPNNFLRTHRSFIVNLNRITAYTAHDIEIGDQEIPIGVSYKSEVMKRLNIH